MTQEELLAENKKLNERLQKAVTVFKEQKDTIARQTAEIEALKAKQADAADKDEQFFEQVEENAGLKSENETLTNANRALNDKLAEQLAINAQKDNEIINIRMQLADVDAKNEQLIKEHNELAERFNVLSSSYSELDVKANNLKDELDKTYEKARTGMEAVRQTTSQIQELNNKLISNFNIFE